MSWMCAEHGPQTQGVVCGGDYPFYLRLSRGQWETEEIQEFPSAYFLYDYDREEIVGFVGDVRGFELTRTDIAYMLDHALGSGCIDEPACPICSEPMEEYDETTY